MKSKEKSANKMKKLKGILKKQQPIRSTKLRYQKTAKTPSITKGWLIAGGGGNAVMGGIKKYKIPSFWKKLRGF